MLKVRVFLCHFLLSRVKRMLRFILYGLLCAQIAAGEMRRGIHAVRTTKQVKLQENISCCCCSAYNSYKMHSILEAHVPRSSNVVSEVFKTFRTIFALKDFLRICSSSSVLLEQTLAAVAESIGYFLSYLASNSESLHMQSKVILRKTYHTTFCNLEIHFLRSTNYVGLYIWQIVAWKSAHSHSKDS